MKAGETIGSRTFSECIRLFGSIRNAAKKLGVSSPSVVYRWGEGTSCPHAYYLAMMLENGADIHYILKGVQQK